MQSIGMLFSKYQANLQTTIPIFIHDKKSYLSLYKACAKQKCKMDIHKKEYVVVRKKE
jgi:uncharacterized protein YbbC (DUF1343 family)